MGITAVTVGLSVMMLWLNHTKHVTRPPYWLRFLVYRVMANAVCYGVCSKKPRFLYFGQDPKDEEGDNNGRKLWRIKLPTNGKSKAATNAAASNLVEIAEIAVEADTLEEGLRAENDSRGKGLIDNVAHIRNKLYTIEKSTKDMMEQILQLGKEKDISEEELEKIKGEWREVTSIINKFSFWVLFIFTLTFIVMCIALWVLRG